MNSLINILNVNSHIFFPTVKLRACQNFHRNSSRNSKLGFFEWQGLIEAVFDIDIPISKNSKFNSAKIMKYANFNEKLRCFKYHSRNRIPQFDSSKDFDKNFCPRKFLSPYKLPSLENYFLSYYNLSVTNIFI